MAAAEIANRYPRPSSSTFRPSRSCRRRRLQPAAAYPAITNPVLLVGDTPWQATTPRSACYVISVPNQALCQVQVKVKTTVGEDVLQAVVVQGDHEQVEQMRKEVQLSEKGMVYVKGIFER